jgi:hypothetical protein
MCAPSVEVVSHAVVADRIACADERIVESGLQKDCVIHDRRDAASQNAGALVSFTGAGLEEPSGTDRNPA